MATKKAKLTPKTKKLASEALPGPRTAAQVLVDSFIKTLNRNALASADRRKE